MKIQVRTQVHLFIFDPKIYELTIFFRSKFFLVKVKYFDNLSFNFDNFFTI